jgi:hypothetical protein
MTKGPFSEKKDYERLYLEGITSYIVKAKLSPEEIEDVINDLQNSIRKKIYSNLQSLDVWSTDKETSH